MTISFAGVIVGYFILTIKDKINMILLYLSYLYYLSIIGVTLMIFVVSML